MTIEAYEHEKALLLDKKSEAEGRLVAVKDAVARAKRNYEATGIRADWLWLSNQEKYARRLGHASQELQRQLTVLKSQYQKEQRKDLVESLREVLLETMPEEVVAEIFRKAAERSQSKSASLTLSQ
jgi:hypothetical protein